MKTPDIALPQLERHPDLAPRVARLIGLSRDRQTYSFLDLQWPQALDPEGWWLPPELLSVHGTATGDGMSETELRALSRWECVNLFSLNVEGERELVSRLASLMYVPQVPGLEEYLHHFIDEENKHMWFFGEFCRRYAGKIYSSKQASLSAESFTPEMDYFLLFARIFVFEEIGAYFNMVAATDQRMDPFVRRIHQIHHADESRHIAFGRALLTRCAEVAFASSSAAEHAAATAHLGRYTRISLEALYQPAMYRDAGFSSGVVLRRQLLADPARKRHHREVLLKRPLKFFSQIGMDLGEAWQ